MIIMSLKVKIFALLGAIFLILAALILPYWRFVNQTLKVSIMSALFSNDDLKMYDNQINFFIGGIGDPTHDGPNLTDSIIIANYNFKTNKLTTISLPRDIWSPTLKDKINSAYAYGEAKKPGGGFILAKAELSDIVGMPIQYAAIIDFSQFKELVDYLGGVDVNVANSFVDKHFPIDGKENDPCGGDPTYACRYQTISFNKGMTHMDGETALKFVRSRYAEGPEGTDFAREARQEKVVDAVKNKVVTMVKKPNVKTYENLYNIFNRVVKRDLTNQQGAIIARNIILKGNFKQNRVVVGQEFFDNPPMGLSQYNGAWVLVPTGGNYSLIHQYIQCYLQGKSNCEALKNKSK